MKKKYRIKSKLRFTLFMTLMILFVFSTAGTVFGAYNSESLMKPIYSEILVQSGDTLWDLAQEFGPEGKDTRMVIHEICRINELQANDIYPGQKILIPAYI
ncbi:LysM peptidoglycan-binding domain-containing protein [Anoxybacterium hadale]|uniref:LysM peptidoglycan-binding domain-containing protein n=1 Tax=Anoxybacterium hadale TaxID=3408580 RepID=A0ACD1A8S9_9FIRM|nr:LysM peptidoglycan-binding domain-containing protein [Clostridiales bacterium]